MTEEVELLDANTQYAHVRRDNGQETTISLRHLAPCPVPVSSNKPSITDSSQPIGTCEEVSLRQNDVEPAVISASDGEVSGSEDCEQITPPLRRSTRVRKSPERLNL